MYLDLIDNLEDLKRMGKILDYKIEEDCVMVTPIPAVPFIFVCACGYCDGTPHD
jgi:hypothetical protein